MAHEPRLTRELRELLLTQRVAALGTLDDQGAPYVSMVPYAIVPAQPALVIHVSALAAHTRHLQARPAVSLLVMQPETASASVHALPRVTLQGHAVSLQPHSMQQQSVRAAYLARFPEAEPITQLPDFRFVLIELVQARQVAGFGAARSLDADAIKDLLCSAPKDPAINLD